MTLPTSDIKFSNLETAYKSSAGIPINIKFSDYFRNGKLVPSYPTTASIPFVTGSTQYGTNLTLSSFRGQGESPWLYRDTMTIGNQSGIITPFIYRAGDTPVVFKDIYNNSTSTSYILKNPTSTVGEPSVISIGGGTINYNNITTDATSLTNMWTQYATVSGAAYNQNINKSMIIDTNGKVLTTPSPPGGFVLASWTETGYMSGTPLSYDGYTVYPWGNYFVAVKSYHPSGSFPYATVKYTSDGINWTSYNLGGSWNGNVGFIVSNGRAFIINGNQKFWTSTNPLDSNSWSERYSAIVSVGYNTSTTVCYNNGAWLVGAHIGRIGRSTTMNDDFASVSGSNSLDVNYYWTNIQARITQIIPYGTGFICFSDANTIAWSSDGLNWYNNIGTTKAVGNSRPTSSIQTHYDPVLDRLYIWTYNGHYYRTNGGDLSFSYGNSNRIALSYTYSANTPNAYITASALSGYSSGRTDLTITVNSGVYLYGTGYYNPYGIQAGLMIRGVNPGDTVKLINNGYIMGMGGQGAIQLVAAYHGGNGQNALHVAGFPITIDTSAGWILGGGGGGGCSSYYNASSPYPNGNPYAADYQYSGGGGGAGGGVLGNGGVSGGGPGQPGGGSYVGTGGRRVTTSGGGGCYREYFDGTLYRGSITAADQGGGGGVDLYGQDCSGTGGAGGNFTAGSVGTYSGGATAHGGGGGWGCSGGTDTDNSSSGGAAGKAIELSGGSVTWVNAHGNVYGAVS